MLGAKESLNQKSFSPDAFKAAYLTFIQEMEALPSKPLVFLVTPIYYAKTVVQKGKPFQMNELDGVKFHIENNTALLQWK